jgi:hypothetical protein
MQQEEGVSACWADNTTAWADAAGEWLRSGAASEGVSVVVLCLFVLLVFFPFARPRFSAARQASAVDVAHWL